MVKNDVFKEKLFEVTENERDRKRKNNGNGKRASQVTKSIMMINSTYILLLTLFAAIFYILTTQVSFPHKHTHTSLSHVPTFI